MNKISKKIASLLILTGMIFLFGCIKDELDVPEVNIPKVDFSSNCTIAGLKLLDPGAGAPLLITSDTIIQGIVVANDESGNFYKKLFLQDNSGAIEVSLDKTDLYTEYRLGQRVYIKCKNLYLGEYGGKVQLGYIYNGAIGRIPEVYIKDHLFLDSLPGPVPSPVLKSTFVFTGADVDMLVKLDSVYFSDAGQTFATSTATTNHNMIDKNENIILLRTSNYATFAGNLLPYGIGSATGILSIFNGDFQFYIRNLYDLTGFDNIPPILNEGFATAGSLGSFMQYSVTGAEIWAQSTYSGDNFAKISGYSSGTYNANEDWLISPAMDMDQYIGEKLKFFSMMNYGAAGDGSLKLYYSSDYSSGAPSTAIWTEIPGLTLSTGGWVKTSSGDVDLSGITGSNVHIAFKYTCSTTNVATWEVGGISVKGTHN